MGLAFRIWEGDNGDKYPQAVSYSQGGANEYLQHANGATTTAAAPLNPGMVFLVMSNELSTPKILFCPSDSLHTAGNGYATNFSYGDLLYTATPGAGAKAAAPSGASKISYFVNGDALEANPQDVMIGDFNIGNQNTANNAASTYAFNQTAAGATPSKEAYSQLNSTPGPPWSTTAASAWAWTQDLHGKSGNLGMADGSCQAGSISGLKQYLQNSTNSAMCVFNWAR